MQIRRNINHQNRRNKLRNSIQQADIQSINKSKKANKAKKLKKRDLELRDYQIPADKFIKDNDFSILAVAPNGGKTEISINVLNDYLKENPNHTALVLTHSTNVLKDNYKDRLDGLKVDFSYSDNFDDNAQVHICLPHNEGKMRKRYDFIVVDEAHENYLAERVQRIIKNKKPKKQLLLTGTPAKFIKKGDGDKIYAIASNEIAEKYFAKLQVELIASNYNWSKEFNSEYEVSNKYKSKKVDTQKALEEIIIKLIERVKNNLTPEQFNDVNFLSKTMKKLKSWAYTYKQLGKTLIICHSIKQAEDVNDILTEKGVNSMVSHSENDLNSLEVKKFKDNKYDVLVVVDRVRLGYSDDDLYNIIDMSGSHNPNVIYQIFSRVLRGNPKMKKYYLKVTTQEYGMMNFTHAAVCAALMLTDKKYLSVFNGDNFRGINIPVLKKPNKQSINVNKEDKENNGEKKSNNKFYFPEFTCDVIDMFKNIIHDLEQPVSIYKLTTIGEVRAMLTGKEVWSVDRILESARG